MRIDAQTAGRLTIFASLFLCLRPGRACGPGEHDLDLTELEQSVKTGNEEVDNSNDIGGIIDADDRNRGEDVGSVPGLLDSALENDDPFIQGAALNEMSRYFLKTGQPEQAYEAAQKSARLNPQYGEAYANGAAAKMALGDEAGARALAKKAAAIWPNHGPHIRMAQVLRTRPQGGLIQAASGKNLLAQALGAFGGGAPEAAGPKGRLLGPKGGAGVAGVNPALLDSSPGAPGRSPSTASTAQGGEASARTKLELGDVQGALSAAQTILIADPENAEALAVVAGAENLNGDFDAAIEAATKALEAGASVEALNARAFAYNQLGHHRSALIDASAALGMFHMNAMALLNRAQALEGIDQIPAALKDYRRAAKLDPSFKKAYAQAYARHAGEPGVDDNLHMGLGRDKDRGGGWLGKGAMALGIGSILGLLAWKRPARLGRSENNRAVTTGVLEALGVSTRSRRSGRTPRKVTTGRRKGKRTW